MPRKCSTAQLDAVASDWLLRREAGLSEPEQAEFDRWLAADLQHGAAMERAEQTWTLLNHLRQAGRGDEMVQALGQRATRRRRRRVLTATLALAAVVIIGLQVHAVRTPNSDVTRAIVSAPEKRVLPDGSTIELKPGADVAVDYSGANRLITLKAGEALFEVAHNKQRPFIVSAQNVHVRAVGTAFVVATQTDQVDVVVTHGTVAVDRGAAARQGGPTQDAPAPTLVGAGHRITLAMAGGAAMPPVLTLSPAQMAARLDWLAPRVKFSDTPLADAVALINRYSQVHFVIDDATLGQMPVSGLLRVDSDADSLISFFQKGIGVDTQQTGDTIVLRRAR